GGYPPARKSRPPVRTRARAPQPGGPARADLHEARVKKIIVKVADWAAERGDGVIVTLGLGSCVAIMLHDPQMKAGAMAHVLLPSRSLAHDTSNLAKFPESAVPLLLERLKALGA